MYGSNGKYRNLLLYGISKFFIKIPLIALLVMLHAKMAPDVCQNRLIKKDIVFL